MSILVHFSKSARLLSSMVSVGLTWRAPPQGPRGATPRHGHPPTHNGRPLPEGRQQFSRSPIKGTPSSNPIVSGLSGAVRRARTTCGGEIHTGYSRRVGPLGVRPQSQARRTVDGGSQPQPTLLNNTFSRENGSCSSTLPQVVTGRGIRLINPCYSHLIRDPSQARLEIPSF